MEEGLKGGIQPGAPSAATISVPSPCPSITQGTRFLSALQVTGASGKHRERALPGAQAHFHQPVFLTGKETPGGLNFRLGSRLSSAQNGQ